MFASAPAPAPAPSGSRFPQLSSSSRPNATPHGRHEPYPRPTAQPRLLPRPIQLPPTSTSYSPSPPTPLKAYQTSSPTGRYQPSRGAQRDARWHARYTERAHLISRGSTGPSPRSPAIPLQAANQPRTPIYPHHQQHSKPPHCQYPPIGQTRPIRPFGGGGHGHRPSIDRIRYEQRNAIAAARRAHAESVAREQAKGEWERKIRRVQLQVYVHARPTKCRWEGCEAILNSWAVLEKHILHAHLTDQRPHSGHGDTSGRVYKAEQSIQCRWGDCRSEFATPEACHHHCLMGHMAEFSARCPFNCRFEGSHFSDLSAHINRRHPSATPDHFVPGLIHFKPTLPPLSSLPLLPLTYSFSPCHEANGRLVRPFLSGIGQRTRRAISRGCISGRRPNVEEYREKKEASIAITRIMADSRQRRSACQDLGQLGQPGFRLEPMTPRSPTLHSMPNQRAQGDSPHHSPPTSSPPLRSQESHCSRRLLIRLHSDSSSIGLHTDSDGDISSRNSRERARSTRSGSTQSGNETETLKRSERLKRKWRDEERDDGPGRYARLIKG